MDSDASCLDMVLLMLTIYKQVTNKLLVYIENYPIDIVTNNNYSMSPRWIWSDEITNERIAQVGYNHFISNKGEWNNCFSKFSNRVLLPIFISTILQRENF